MDRWKKESERHQSRIVSIYMLPFGRLHTPREVFTRKTAPPPPLRPYINKTNNVTSRETNVLTKFHENWAEIVTSRVFTCFHYIHIEKTAPPTGGHVFSPIWTIFELVRDINKTNVLTNHVFQRTLIIFELNSHWTKNVTSRVFTCFHYIQIEKTAPPPGGHVFSPIWTIFELVRDIN
ncbi:hypothetical protein DPMN_006696 [Dreissena polymorpha]|uniref:Uncharacterized protein n=1 Tax=Dreissena polymorpha TaxID=45954 RepID=A0A9D4RV74_DREPO|nr:hypothetical protein DPMN_006696 [Dreissena polymorpha]